MKSVIFIAKETKGGNGMKETLQETVAKQIAWLAEDCRKELEREKARKKETATANENGGTWSIRQYLKNKV